MLKRQDIAHLTCPDPVNRLVMELRRSVIHDPEKAAQQPLTMVRSGYVVANDGTKVKVKPESICVHGDTPTAVAILQKIRESLKKASIAVKPMGK